MASASERPKESAQAQRSLRPRLPRYVATVDGRNPFASPEKPWETTVCLHLQRNHHSGLPRWCRISSIHSTSYFLRLATSPGTCHVH